MGTRVVYQGFGMPLYSIYVLFQNELVSFIVLTYVAHIGFKICCTFVNNNPRYVMSRHIGRILFTVLSTISIFFNAGLALEPQKPMPPKFSIENDPVKVLNDYPLGIINKQDAFAHHGGAIRKLSLPNGNTGWLYKAGEEIGIPSLYILHFSKEGVVIDVLHKDSHYRYGHSALQYQFLANSEVQLNTLGAAPGQQ